MIFSFVIEHCFVRICSKFTNIAGIFIKIFFVKWFVMTRQVKSSVVFFWTFLAFEWFNSKMSIQMQWISPWSNTGPGTKRTSFLRVSKNISDNSWSSNFLFIFWRKKSKSGTVLKNPTPELWRDQSPTKFPIPIPTVENCPRSEIFKLTGPFYQVLIFCSGGLHIAESAYIAESAQYRKILKSPPCEDHIHLYVHFLFKFHLNKFRICSKTGSNGG
jgi:hypothetical protein